MRGSGRMQQTKSPDALWQPGLLALKIGLGRHCPPVFQTGKRLEAHRTRIHRGSAMLEAPAQDLYPRVSRHHYFKVGFAAFRFDNLQVDEFGRGLGQMVGSTHFLIRKLVYARTSKSCVTISGYRIAVAGGLSD